MSAGRTIDGTAFAAELRARVGAAVSDLKDRQGVTPGLAVVLVGENPASQVYVRNKGRQTVQAGMRSFDHTLAAEVSEADLLRLIATLNADEAVDGILVQLPLPAHIDTDKVIAAVDPKKDVDGFHPLNVGKLAAGGGGLVPCTPAGSLMLIKSVRPDIAGADAVVVGRSTIVGRPMAALLLNESCTVTVAHSKTRDLPGVSRRADILVVAVGRPEFVKAEWVKPGAVVIDVGINRVQGRDGEKARLVGDVAFAAAQEVASAITPVPGGVGPMTIACLLANTLTAACRRRGLREPDVAPAGPPR